MSPPYISILGEGFFMPGCHRLSFGEVVAGSDCFRLNYSTCDLPAAEIFKPGGSGDIVLVFAAVSPTSSDYYFQPNT